MKEKTKETEIALINLCFDVANQQKEVVKPSAALKTKFALIIETVFVGIDGIQTIILN